MKKLILILFVIGLVGCSDDYEHYREDISPLIICKKELSRKNAKIMIYTIKSTHISSVRSTLNTLYYEYFNIYSLNHNHDIGDTLNF